MTEREAFEVYTTQEAIYHRCGWRCEVCGRTLLDGTPQLGHKIPQSKMMVRKYGREVIHHPLNMAATCSLKCNAAVSIRKPADVEDLVTEIRAAIRGG